jgi:hypothetical protein
MEPRISLAVSVQSNKGVYALLLGSGISRDARIRTAWAITEDLITRVAQVRNELDASAPDPAKWYREQFGVDPNCSDLLEQLGGTPAERQQLLRGYFEPTADERADGVKVPTDAHHAIAELVVGGYIRVIVTTNFDHLLEQALESVGITPVVLSTPDAIEGALPLAHVPGTIIKLHGDYLDARILNTVGELEHYDPRVNSLLDQVLDEYGLIVCGWSADWDTALRSAIERATNRRFSTFWAYPRSLSEYAQRLIALRMAIPVPGVTANTFFRQIAEDVKSLEELAGPPPLSAAVAAQTVKRYLPHSVDRIRLRDMLMAEVSRARDLVLDPGVLPVTTHYSEEQLLESLGRLESGSAIPMSMYAVAGFWVENDALEPWVDALNWLLDVPDPSGRLGGPAETLRRYPALLSSYAGGMAALAHNRFDILVALLTMPRLLLPDQSQSISLVVVASPASVLGSDAQKTLAGPQRTTAPFSLRLSNERHLRAAVRQFVRDDQTFVALFDQFEYLSALMMYDEVGGAPVGTFVWRGGGSRRAENRPVIIQLKHEIDQFGENLPLLKAGAFGGSLARLKRAKARFESRFEQSMFRCAMG